MATRVFRRQLSTLIPPKVASAQNLGAAPNSKRMENVISFYKALPRGEAPAAKSSGPWGWYKRKYFEGENASIAPLFHFIGFAVVFGYLNHYKHIYAELHGGHH